MRISLDLALARIGPLRGADVHLWYVALDLPSETVAELALLLSPDERQRAARYHFAVDRAHFIAGRGSLRLLLGSYLVRAPEALCFAYDTYGKPSLDLNDSSDLAFSASRSGDLACIAITRVGALGVDIERVRSDMTPEECMRIAERTFAPEESRALRALPRDQRRAAFFTIWTRKEAYAKARGVGLTQPLAQFSVSLDSEHPTILDAGQDNGSLEGTPALWQFLPIKPPTNYAAALVVERASLPRHVVRQEWASTDARD